MHNVPMHNVLMGNVLILESSTEHGSVAAVIEGRIAAEIQFAARDPGTGERTESLAPAVSQALSDAALGPRQLSAVICSGGPGGFTSLRAAAAIAKGMCFALDIPLYGVSSLAVLAWSANASEGRYCAAIAAGRNEWFGARFVVAPDGAIKLGPAFLAGDDALRNMTGSDGLRLVGAGLDVQAFPRASSVAAHLDEIEALGAVDVDAWEPAYGRAAEAQVKWEAAHGRPLVA